MKSSHDINRFVKRSLCAHGLRESDKQTDLTSHYAGDYVITFTYSSRALYRQTDGQTDRRKRDLNSGASTTYAR